MELAETNLHFMNTPEQTFVIIEHADGDGSEVLHLCATQEERIKTTRALILGTESPEAPCPEIAELERDGIVYFEGDPGLEWRNVFIATALPASGKDGAKGGEV